jgi:acetyl esterase/lipase
MPTISVVLYAGCAQSIAAVVDTMKAAGVPVELFMYAHCGHAFMNALTAGGRDKIKGEAGADAMTLSGVCAAQLSSTPAL